MLVNQAIEHETILTKIHFDVVMLGRTWIVQILLGWIRGAYIQMFCDHPDWRGYISKFMSTKKGWLNHHFSKWHAYFSHPGSAQSPSANQISSTLFFWRRCIGTSWTFLWCPSIWWKSLPKLFCLAVSGDLCGDGTSFALKILPENE